MPYIPTEDRPAIDEHISAIEYLSIGELNYAITSLIQDYLREVDNHMAYSDINEVIGVLECAKMELYRRIAVPYEERKIKENGDVY